MILAARVSQKIENSIAYLSSPPLDRISFGISLPRTEESLDQITLRDVGRLCQQVLYISVQVVYPSFCNRVVNIVNRTRQIWQCSLLGASIPSLGGKFSQQSNLQIVEIFVIPCQLPGLAILHQHLNNKPKFVFGETVFGYMCRDRSVQPAASRRSPFFVFADA